MKRFSSQKFVQSFFLDDISKIFWPLKNNEFHFVRPHNSIGMNFSNFSVLSDNQEASPPQVLLIEFKYPNYNFESTKLAFPCRNKINFIPRGASVRHRSTESIISFYLKTQFALKSNFRFSLLDIIHTNSYSSPPISFQTHFVCCNSAKKGST